jgi:hypothetical protein
VIDDYRRALDAALREYERALADQAALETRLAQLRQTIGTLTTLCGLTPTVAFGLTDACRMVLRSAAEPMTALAVRDRLAAVGIDLDRYANPLAAIHTVLKRLVAAGDAVSQRAGPAHRVAYRAMPSPRPTPTSRRPAVARATSPRPRASR